MVNGQQTRSKDATHSGGSILVTGKAGAGRRERRAAETRLRLFRCALELFAKRGFSSVTVEDITDAADVGKGTFFNYFESKDHVLGVLAEIQIGKVKQAAALAAPGGRSIRQLFHRLLLALTEEPGRNPRLARAFISSFLASREVREILKRKMQEGRKAIGEIVAAGQQSGEIDARLKKEKLAVAFLETVLGTVLFWSLHEKPSLRICMEESFQHFWRSIEAAGTGEPPQRRRRVKR